MAKNLRKYYIIRPIEYKPTSYMNFSKVNIKRMVLFISFIFALLYVLNRFIDFVNITLLLSSFTLK